MYEIPTLNSVVYTCRLHVDDMFDEMSVMASRGLVMVFFILFILHIFFLVFLPILSYHSIMGSIPGFRPKKVTQILEC